MGHVTKLLLVITAAFSISNSTWAATGAGSPSGPRIESNVDLSHSTKVNIGLHASFLSLDSATLNKTEYGERFLTPSQPQTGDSQMNILNFEQYTCQAWVTCANGSTISCWSQGDSCHWEYQAGSYVYCSATGNDGSFSWVRYTCN